MRWQLTVKVSQKTGLPFVEIPHDDMGELVEHLSSQRSAVNYTYQADYFTVSFLHLDAAAVQRLLADWNPDDCSTDREIPVEAFTVTAMTA